LVPVIAGTSGSPWNSRRARSAAGAPGRRNGRRQWIDRWWLLGPGSWPGIGCTVAFAGPVPECGRVGWSEGGSLFRRARRARRRRLRDDATMHLL